MVSPEHQENHAQRVNVGTAVEPARVAGELFGAHVGERAQQLAGPRLAHGRQNVGGRDVSNAEVEHLGLSRFLDQNVAGLQVPMNHPPFVGMLHCIANLGQ